MVQKSFKSLEVGTGSLPQYLQGFIHTRWLFGISSITSMIDVMKPVEAKTLTDKPQSNTLEGPHLVWISTQCLLTNLKNE